MIHRPVLVSGASGLVGRALIELLAKGGVPSRALSRNPTRAPRELRALTEFFEWDGKTPPREAIADCGAIVHLAGEPIFAGRLTAARRRKIVDSRIESTARLIERLAELPAQQRPSCLICASAVGIYGDRGDERLTEDATPRTGFLADLCRTWEEKAGQATALGLRACSLRIGIVISHRGGALPRMALPFRLGIGGPFGNGQHWVPWIHIDDLARLILWLIQQEDLHGPVNAVAPGCVRNAELAQALGKALHRPSWISTPAFALRLALGELARELLDSRCVVPARACDAGFQFDVEEIDTALARELARISR